MGQHLEPQQVHPHAEPCMVSYGGVTCYPQPFNSRTIIPPPGNRTGFDPRYLPENHGWLPYVITQYNGEHCNTFMVPSGVFPVPINQGVHDHLPFSNNHQIFERNRSLVMEGPNDAFKRKNIEGFPRNFPGFYRTPGSSSSVATSEGTMMDATSYGAHNDIRLGMEGGLNRGGRNRATGVMGFDHVGVHNNNRLIHGGQPTQTVPTPLLDQHGANGAFPWNRAHGVPYLQGCINGDGMEAANMGIHGYQVATMSRNSSAYMHPPPITSHQGSHNLYHPPPLPPMPPPVQAQNMDVHLHLASTSHRHSISTSTGNPFQHMVDPGPRFVVPTPPNGLRIYEAHRRELMIESTARHRSFPNLRVLPEDELLALGEQIGNVGSGLSETSISDHLKTRTFRSCNPEDPLPADEEHNFCVICQTEFEDQEKIGVLDCRHDYHSECIKKWLTVKNTCPICKSTAIALITN
ncbi:probable E3 ubiquitin-protein ligase ZFP1 isoform X2 [Cynara cardunculus var. scolymus]|nr:probable E3 ubiquitin-protein ligase ZFP1 isoform X2 [Cynara cardunculus var. scolymus]